MAVKQGIGGAFINGERNSMTLRGGTRHGCTREAAIRWTSADVEWERERPPLRVTVRQFSTLGTRAVQDAPCTRVRGQPRSWIFNICWH